MRRWRAGRRCRRGLRAVDIVGTGGDRFRAASISPPARRCSRPPAGCRWSSTAIARSRAAAAAPMCSRRSACRCRWMSRRPAAASRPCGFTFLFAPHYHAATKGDRAGARGARRAHGVQHPGPLVNPAEPPFTGRRRLQPRRRRAHGAGAAGLPHRARLRRSTAPRVGMSRRRWARSRCSMSARAGVRRERALARPTTGCALCSAHGSGGRRCRAQRARAAARAVRRGPRRASRCLLLGAALALEVAGARPSAARRHRARGGGDRQRRGARAACYGWRASAREHGGGSPERRPERRIFCEQMAQSSRERVRAARGAAARSARCRQRARATPPPPRLRLSPRRLRPDCGGQAALAGGRAAATAGERGHRRARARPMRAPVRPRSRC